MKMATNEMLLLGAGASVPANVPASYAMTREICDIIGKSRVSRHSHLIKFVVGGLLFQKGIRDEDPFQGVDVEELFNAVILLADRTSLEAAPFIGSWHALVEKFDQVPSSYGSMDKLNTAIYESVSTAVSKAVSARPGSFDADKIDKALVKAIQKTVVDSLKNRSTSLYSDESVGKAVETYLEKQTKNWSDKLRSDRPSSSTFSREFKAAVVALGESPGEGQIYKSIAEQMIGALKDLAWINAPDRVSYLAPLKELCKSQGNVTIATLNYDNSIELFAETQGLQCNVGVESWSASGGLELQEQGINLLKLHGSIDWAFQESPPKGLPVKGVRRLTQSEVHDANFKPAVIFGQRNKLTAEGPFLDLLLAFRNSLDQHALLTIIGYSLRDVHINEYISRWLNGDPSRRVRIIDPNFGSNKTDFASDLRAFCGPTRLEVIGKPAQEALADIYGASLGL
jgi:hypothetical protein